MIENSLNQSTLTEIDLKYLKNAQFIRNNIHPFIELIGGLNNFIIILLIEPSIIFNKLKKSTVGLSRSGTIYFSAIALVDTLFLWSSIFQTKSWYLNIFQIDPISFNQLSCKIYQFLFHFFQFTSSWLLVAFTFERFTLIFFTNLTINRKFAAIGDIYKFKKYSKNAGHIILYVIIASFLFNLHFLLTANVEYSICLQYSIDSRLITRLGPIICAIIIIHIPFVLLILFNVAICIKILKNNKNLLTKTRKIQRKYKASRNIALLLMTITFSFIILLGPITTWNIIVFSRPELFKEPFFIYLRSIFFIFSKLNYGSNLYIYLALNKRFRLRLKYLLFSRWISNEMPRPISI